MIQSRYTLNFSIKKTRLNSKGEAPIYLRLTINNDRREKAVSLYVDPENWNQKVGLCNGKDRLSLAINDQLHVIRAKMLGVYTALSSLCGQPTTADVISKFLGIEPKKEEHQFYLKLSGLIRQFRRVATNYNQATTRIHLVFSEQTAKNMLSGLRRDTAKMGEVMRKIIEVI